MPRKSSFLPYYFKQPNNDIVCIGLTPDSTLTPDEAARLQAVHPRAMIGPNLDRLPPRKREPIRDIPLNTPAQTGLVALVCEKRAPSEPHAPDCQPPVPPACAELASGRRQDAGPGAYCPETVPAPALTGAEQTQRIPPAVSQPASPPGLSFELREWARRQCRKVLRQLGKDSA